MSVPNVMAIHQMVVEIFQSGPSQTDRTQTVITLTQNNYSQYHHIRIFEVKLLHISGDIGDHGGTNNIKFTSF